VAVSAAPASTRSASSSSTYVSSEDADVPVVEFGVSVVTVFTVEKPRATHGPGTGRDHERRVVQTRTHIRRRLERLEADAELLADMSRSCTKNSKRPFVPEHPPIRTPNK
jgi:hypothetical protein